MDNKTDTYNTIETEAKGYILENRSKFYSFAYPVVSEEEVKERLDALRKEYYDARHHCYAYILGANKDYYRANDDGEPSGSAGKPIHGQLLSNDLTDILVVVVRYFGGVKLGVPGLITAYKAATVDALTNAKVITKIVKCRYEIGFEYLDMNKVMKIVKDEELEILGTEFDMSCKLTFAVRANDADRVIKIMSGYDSGIKYINGINT